MADTSGEQAESRPAAKPSQRRRARPDPLPSRLMIGVGAVAALTVIGAGLVRFPVAATETTPTAAEDRKAPRTGKAERPVRYIKLKRGEKAPKGAKVIRKAAPTPRIVVRRVTVSKASAASTPTKTRRKVTRTQQSGQ
jgi:hypothetical protein